MPWESSPRKVQRFMTSAELPYLLASSITLTRSGISCGRTSKASSSVPSAFFSRSSAGSWR